MPASDGRERSDLRGATHEVVLTGATIVVPEGPQTADIWIAAGMIRAIGRHLRPIGVRAIDVDGCTILPGAIDLHVHFEEPGNEQREDFSTGTAAAAAGGTTFVVEHPLSEPPTTTADRYQQKRDLVSRHAYVDFGLWGGAIPGNAAEFVGMAAAGAPGFKGFMVGSEPEYPRLDADSLRVAMRGAAALNEIVVVHPEDEDLVNAATLAIEATGRRDPFAWGESRPPEAERRAVEEAVAAARETGARLHLAHLSTPASVEVAVRAKRAGANVLLETCPHYLLLDSDDLVRLGPWAKSAPPLRSRTDVEGLWQQALAGDIDVIASDHAPWEPAEKSVGESDIWLARNGFQSLQLMNVLTIPRWLERGGTLESWVSRTSTTPAQWLGIYPRKGIIAEGADADLAIYRTGPARRVSASELRNRHQWTPFDGMPTTWSVVATMVRGEWAYRDGELVAQPFGRFVPLPQRRQA